MTHTTPNQVLSIRERLKTIPAQSAALTLTLNFDLRQKHSLRITMGNGKEVLLSLPRGQCCVMVNIYVLMMARWCKGEPKPSQYRWCILMIIRC
ncbi:MAG: hypothetical protein R3E08_09500 [Thiotrichaceae bacterium]